MDHFTARNRTCHATEIDEKLKADLLDQGFMGVEIGKMYVEQDDGQKYVFDKEHFDKLFMSTAEAHKEFIAITLAYAGLVQQHADLLEAVKKHLKDIGCA